jgi:hypothetical protein
MLAAFNSPHVDSSSPSCLLLLIHPMLTLLHMLAAFNSPHVDSSSQPSCLLLLIHPMLTLLHMLAAFNSPHVDSSSSSCLLLLIHHACFSPQVSLFHPHHLLHTTAQHDYYVLFSFLRRNFSWITSSHVSQRLPHSLFTLVNTTGYLKS